MEDVQVIFQCSPRRSVRDAYTALVARPKRVLPHAGETEMAGVGHDPDGRWQARDRAAAGL